MSGNLQNSSYIAVSQHLTELSEYSRIFDQRFFLSEFSNLREVVVKIFQTIETPPAGFYDSLHRVDTKCRNYWKNLKGKFHKESIELVSITHHFKFETPDGKQRKANALDAEGVQTVRCFVAPNI